MNKKQEYIPIRRIEKRYAKGRPLVIEPTSDGYVGVHIAVAWCAIAIIGGLVLAAIGGAW